LRQLLTGGDIKNANHAAAGAEGYDELAVGVKNNMAEIWQAGQVGSCGLLVLWVGEITSWSVEWRPGTVGGHSSSVPSGE